MPDRCSTACFDSDLSDIEQCVAGLFRALALRMHCLGDVPEQASRVFFDEPKYSPHQICRAPRRKGDTCTGLLNHEAYWVWRDAVFEFYGRYLDVAA